MPPSPLPALQSSQPPPPAPHASPSPSPHLASPPPPATSSSAPPSVSSSSSAAATTATATATATGTMTITPTATAGSSSSPPNPNPTPPTGPNQNPCPNSDPSSSNTATPPSAATKIPFRPRKTRKISSSSTPSTQGDVKIEAGAQGHNTTAAATTTTTITRSNSNNHSRMVFRVPARPLSAEGEVEAALRHLRAVDPQLARVIDAHDPPVFQSLHPPFHSLTRSILYQQLAYKAAASIYSRFLALCGGESCVVPEAVLALTPHQLRQIGVSGRKASYLHDLANKYRTGILSDASIVAMDDKSLFAMLTMVKGIGAWSVHMFMVFSLHRPDVLPVGDLGVRKGVQLLYGLDALPRPSQMDQLCERWRPYRSVGAWYMWRLVEVKSAPTVLASSSGAVALPLSVTAGGGGGTSLIMGVPSPSPPPPLLLQQTHLHPQQQMQQIQQIQQQQQQHQLQLQPQLIDPIQSIPNLG